MTDDFETAIKDRLETAAASIEPRDRLAEIRSTTQRSRRILWTIAAVTVAAAISTLVAISSTGSGPDVARVRTGSSGQELPGPTASTPDAGCSTTSARPPGAVVPAGMTLVLDSCGGMPGYVPTAQLHGRPPPQLNLGTGKYPVYGLVVTGWDGLPVGYTLSEIGYIDAATAADPLAVDAKLVAYQHRQSDVCMKHPSRCTTSSQAPPP